MYSAKSVVTALKADNKLICANIDNIACPCPTPHKGCSAPKDCDLCKKQNCKQTITVRSDSYLKLATLNFKFRVSHQDYDGFINKEDASLKLLLKNWSQINKDLLKEINLNAV